MKGNKVIIEADGATTIANFDGASPGIDGFLNDFDFNDQIFYGA